jgi:hypothetical protein
MGDTEFDLRVKQLLTACSCDASRTSFGLCSARLVSYYRTLRLQLRVIVRPSALSGTFGLRIGADMRPARRRFRAGIWLQRGA